MAKRSILIASKPQAFANLDIESTENWDTLTVKAPNGKALVTITVDEGKFVVKAASGVAAPKVEAPAKESEADEA